jgi:CubicO group peptidase (beta-lactamase class C family)
MMLRMVCIAAAFAAAAPAQQDAAAIIAGLNVQEVLDRHHVPGISIAAIQDYRIHWAQGFGVADAATGRKVDASTAFQAASISKPVTAMAALLLAQEGKLALDADINTVLKSWRVPESEYTRGHPVTARALFSHTSGTDDGFGFPGYAPSAARPTLVEILDGKPPSNTGPVLFARAPYAAFKYSGGGLTIAQLALADLTGKAFADLMRDRILTPLGMTGSSYQQPPDAAMSARAAHAHDGTGKPRAEPWHVYPEQAAAGLWTTASDLARFLIEVQIAVRGPAGKVLKQDAARQMTTPVGVGSYAVGLAVSKRGEGWYVGHGGSNWGFRGDIQAHVRKGYGVAILTNGDAGSAAIQEIEAKVAAAYHWDSLDKPLPR